MVQGVAEVVPVSSSAHLTLVPALLGWPATPDRTPLAAGLHAGSCLGLAVALSRDPPGRSTAALALATSAPAALAGALASDAVERRLGGVRQVAGLSALAGAALALADRRPQARGVGPRQAAVAALAQVLALAPGVSRSGAALTALRACGVRRDDAVRFSLLMSLPVTAGAAVWSLSRADPHALRDLRPALAWGLPAAAAAAERAATVRARVPVGPFAPWAAYRLALAAGVTVHSVTQPGRRRTRP